MSTVLWKIKRKTKVNLWIVAKSKKQILPQVHASQEFTSSLEKQSEAVTSQAIDEEQALVAQINLNSRLQDPKKSNTESSIPQENNYRPENNTPDKVLGSLLQSGIAGSKIERSRQPLKSMQKNERVSIDEHNQNIFVDQQDTSINIIDFLTALQVNTKLLAKQFLNVILIDWFLTKTITSGHRLVWIFAAVKM